MKTFLSVAIFIVLAAAYPWIWRWALSTFSP